MYLISVHVVLALVKIPLGAKSFFGYACRPPFRIAAASTRLLLAFPFA
jgi:hypothetical protein